MTDLPDRSEQLDDLNTKLEMVTNLANFYNSEVAIIKQQVRDVETLIELDKQKEAK